MDKFVRRLLLFSITLIGIFLFNGIINYLIYTNNFCDIRESNILITGDSHLRRALNPESFNDAINISQQGEPLPLTYWKVKKILKTYTPDTLIVGLAPHNISTYQDYKFLHDQWAKEMIKRSYPIQGCNSFKKVKIDYPTYFKVLWKETAFYPTLNHCNYIGSYSPVETTDLSQINKKIKHHYFYQGTKSGISEIAVYYLNRLLDLSHSNNLKLVIVSSPVHPNYYEKIPLNIVESYNSLIEQIKSKGIRVINKTNDFYPDSLYKDADHLNKYGANRFTNEVKRILTGS